MYVILYILVEKLFKGISLPKNMGNKHRIADTDNHDIVIFISM